MTTPVPAAAHQPGFFRGRDMVRWGIIGCGDVTEVKSGPGFQQADGSQLVAVMRRNASRAADYARRHGVARWYSDAENLINDPEVDAVYVATPPDAHLNYAVKVAAAGKPAYVEKPMARNTAECDAMIAAFAAARVPLYVAYYRRRLPRFLLVKDLLAQRVIGDVTGVLYCQSEPFHRRDGGWRTHPTVAGGGHFLDVGSHVLDLMDDFFGPLRNVTGHAANLASDYDVEDSVAMSFRMEGGVPGAGLWNFASHIRSDRFRINGTEGQIEFSVFENAPVRLETAKGAETFVREHPPHVQQPLIQSVVGDLLGRNICPSTGESARRTTRVIDAALASFYGGRHDAFWERIESWPGWRRRAKRA
jgi:1,5-anhydro-D-fructose reductase (1,5-anhydro-D-mannitol-forming)